MDLTEHDLLRGVFNLRGQISEAIELCGELGNGSFMICRQTVP
jgi:chemotaxis signal transduction protein